MEIDDLKRKEDLILLILMIAVLICSCVFVFGLFLNAFQTAIWGLVGLIVSGLLLHFAAKGFGRNGWQH